MPTPDYYIKNGHECQECIDMITADCSGGEAFIIGNIIKYLWRYKGKNGSRDLDKAKNYIDMLLANNRTWYSEEPFIYEKTKEKADIIENEVEKIVTKINEFCGRYNNCDRCPMKNTEFYKKYSCNIWAVKIAEFINQPDRMVPQLLRFIEEHENAK